MGAQGHGRIPGGIIKHHMRVCPNVRPLKQKAMQQFIEKQALIVQDTPQATGCWCHQGSTVPGVAGEPSYRPQERGKERMCVDFTNHTKACPQDTFTFPHIDQIIDCTAECDLPCFLDAFSGYHQIKMVVKDVEKTTFLTP